MTDTPVASSFKVTTDRTPGYADVARAFGYDPGSGAPMTEEQFVARRSGEGS